MLEVFVKCWIVGVLVVWESFRVRGPTGKLEIKCMTSSKTWKLGSGFRG